MLKNIFICGIFFQISLFSESLAQDAPIVYMEIVSGNGLNENTSAVDDSTVLKGTFILQLQDTSNISKIHIKLGTTLGGSDLFSRVFEFNPVGEFSDGTSLRKEGDKIYFGIGNFTGLNHFYSEAIIENNTGGLSLPYRYSR